MWNSYNININWILIFGILIDCYNDCIHNLKW